MQVAAPAGHPPLVPPQLTYLNLIPSLGVPLPHSYQPDVFA
eukprot:SAG31_NODE_41137_length_277_cov_0.988764_1_plen_40_part_01